LIRDNDTELPAPTQILLQSTRRSQRVELLVAAMETENPIVSARLKARKPALVPGQIRPAAERSLLRQAGPGKLSGTVAKLRRLLSQPPPPLFDISNNVGTANSGVPMKTIRIVD
jgi:hypothetical protein